MKKILLSTALSLALLSSAQAKDGFQITAGVDVGVMTDFLELTSPAVGGSVALKYNYKGFLVGLNGGAIVPVGTATSSPIIIKSLTIAGDPQSSAGRTLFGRINSSIGLLSATFGYQWDITDHFSISPELAVGASFEKVEAVGVELSGELNDENRWIIDETQISALLGGNINVKYTFENFSLGWFNNFNVIFTGDKIAADSIIGRYEYTVSRDTQFVYLSNFNVGYSF